MCVCIGTSAEIFSKGGIAGMSMMRRERESCCVRFSLVEVRESEKESEEKQEQCVMYHAQIAST